jgi:hypothetical protein
MKKEEKMNREKRSVISLKATWSTLCGMSYRNFPLILAGVHPLLAPLIMFRLKRRGFSNCRVDITGRGLVVFAQR